MVVESPSTHIRTCTCIVSFLFKEDQLKNGLMVSRSGSL
jgi:hypothetical protein